MKKLFFLFFFSLLFPQNNNLYVDGVAAVVENKIVLKSDLNQMVNMMALQQKIDPNQNRIQYLKLRDAVLSSMIDQKILLELAEEDTTIEVSEKEVDTALDQQIENILIQAGGKTAAEKMLGQSIKSFRSEFWFDMKDKIVSEKYEYHILFNLNDQRPILNDCRPFKNWLNKIKRKNLISMKLFKKQEKFSNKVYIFIHKVMFL